MFKREILIPILFSAYLYSGCSTVGNHQKALDYNWGRSFETAKYTQIIAHDAGMEQHPVVGLSGEAAIINVDRYNASTSDTQAMPQKELKINLDTGM